MWPSRNAGGHDAMQCECTIAQRYFLMNEYLSATKCLCGWFHDDFCHGVLFTIFFRPLIDNFLFLFLIKTTSDYHKYTRSLLCASAWLALALCTSVWMCQAHTTKLAKYRCLVSFLVSLAIRINRFVSKYKSFVCFLIWEWVFFLNFGRRVPLICVHVSAKP